MNNPVCVFVLVVLSIMANAKQINLCYNNDSQVCASNKDELACDGRRVIRLRGRFLHNVSTCDGTTCGTGTQENRFNNADYELELQRRCSASNSCNMTDVSSVGSFPGKSSVKIYFDCVYLDNKVFDPCNTENNSYNLTKRNNFLLGRSFGNYQSCMCILSPRGMSNISVGVVDIRLSSRADACRNNSVQIYTSNTNLLYNCSNEPIYHRKNTITNWNGNVSVSISMDREVKPEMIFIFFNLSSPNNVHVNCRSKTYDTITTKVTAVPEPTITHTTSTPDETTALRPITNTTATVTDKTTMLLHESTTVEVHVPGSTASSTAKVYKTAQKGDNDGGLEISAVAAIACIAAVVAIGMAVTAVCLIRRKKKHGEKGKDHRQSIVNAAYQLDTNTVNGQPPSQHQQVNNDYVESPLHLEARIQDDKEPDYETAQEVIGTNSAGRNRGLTGQLPDDDGYYSHLGTYNSKPLTGPVDETYSHLAASSQSKAPMDNIYARVVMRKNEKQPSMPPKADNTEFQESDYDHLTAAGHAPNSNDQGKDNLYSHITHAMDAKQRGDDDTYSYAKDIDDCTKDPYTEDMADHTYFTLASQQS